MIWLINCLVVILVVIIIYWFWLAKPKQLKLNTDHLIEIIVDKGVYQPAHLSVKAGADITLRFIRKAASPCAAVVMFPELDMSEELPLNVAKEIKLKLSEKGTYTFTCEMAMYRGSIEVT